MSHDSVQPDPQPTHDVPINSEPGSIHASADDADVLMTADQLSHAFAQLMGQTGPVESPSPPTETSTEPPVALISDADTAVSPASILEAVLFVGHPDNAPLSSQMLAKLMRGVSPAEVDSLIDELNRNYRQEDAPYEIVAEGQGYRMSLRDGFTEEKGRIAGKVREARLSQSSIDLLAIVAYNQPIDRHEIDRIRGKPSGSVLNQLVRRDLLAIERTNERPRRTLYRTTNRFLALFQLASLDDLPTPEDL
jgi:segregation and condensation protein B